MKTFLKNVILITLVLIINSCDFPYSFSDNRTKFPKELLGKWHLSDNTINVIFLSKDGKLFARINNSDIIKAFYTEMNINDLKNTFVSIYLPNEKTKMKYSIFRIKIEGNKIYSKKLKTSSATNFETEKKFRFNLSANITLSKEKYEKEEVFYREGFNNSSIESTNSNALGRIKTSKTTSPSFSITDKARKYYDNKEYTKAFNLFSECANDGDERCQYVIAEMYFRGQAVNKNYSNAFYWYKKCAENGLQHCYRPVGLMYAFGEGTKKNFGEGKKWLKKSGFHMCYKCWGDGDLECEKCKGSGRRYSWSGADIGACVEDCERGEIDCYVCEGIGVYDPNE